MSDDVWNDDVIYAFSIHRTFMQILGLWPLQKKTIFTIIHWSVMIFLLFTPLCFMYLEFIGSHNDSGRHMDATVYTVLTGALNLNYVYIAGKRDKLAKNINAAITDWLSAKSDEKSYKIMKKQAFESRLWTLIMLYSAATCCGLYVLSVVFANLIDVFLPDETVNVSNGSVSARERTFIIPYGDLVNEITSLQYAIVTAFHAFQLTVICTMQSVSDAFYISITLHLTGQLKVLTEKFKMFASNKDTQVNRKQFISLINRHCELMEYSQNVEETFSINILYKFVGATLLLALLGLRILICLKSGDYVASTRTTLLMNYVILESLVYCYGGDFIQKGSQDIFHAMFMTSWFTLPATFMKDVNFAMMRSRYPFRLTGGKFFYVNCEAIGYILKTAGSYVSVLRVALRD
ncbi:PREDICTED: odorant receptor 4-like [Wasmannia auropunctata]|uniref:odorant receptor 4-like n=1 Tax=Wasmannia auropunctata TaxID=64793 RepID=UPI0005EE0DFB|nr:PREDICTED: odorant receptor 4-like [Wasmannia auropunctata]